VPRAAATEITATAPTTIPPIAPPDMCAEGLGSDVGGVVDAAGALETFGEAVEEAEVSEDVWVAAISVIGSKVQELADGLEELKEEYV